LEAMHIFDCVDIQEALKLCIFLIGNICPVPLFSM